MTDWLEIGKIVGAYGLQGTVRVCPSSDFPERFLQPGERWLLRPGMTEPERVRLKGGRFQEGKGLFLVDLEGIGDRDQAEALRDCRLMVSVADRPHLEPGEFHVMDLIGLPVFDQQSQALIGVVIDLGMAGNDLLIVQRPESHAEVLIPFVQEIVPIVDLAQKRIEINPPPGLLDLSGPT